MLATTRGILQSHGIHVVERLVAADHLVVELVVAVRRWQERISVGHEKIEDDDHLE